MTAGLSATRAQKVSANRFGTNYNMFFWFRSRSQTHHVRLTLQVAAGRKDERRLRSITSKWVERGHVGNISLVQPTPAILLTPLTSFSHQVSTRNDLTLITSKVISFQSFYANTVTT